MLECNDYVCLMISLQNSNCQSVGPSWEQEQADGRLYQPLNVQGPRIHSSKSLVDYRMLLVMKERGVLEGEMHSETWKVSMSQKKAGLGDKEEGQLEIQKLMSSTETQGQRQSPT